MPQSIASVGKQLRDTCRELAKSQNVHGNLRKLHSIILKYHESIRGGKGSENHCSIAEELAKAEIGRSLLGAVEILNSTENNEQANETRETATTVVADFVSFYEDASIQSLKILAKDIRSVFEANLRMITSASQNFTNTDSELENTRELTLIVGWTLRLLRNSEMVAGDLFNHFCRTPVGADILSSALAQAMTFHDAPFQRSLMYALYRLSRIGLKIDKMSTMQSLEKVTTKAGLNGKDTQHHLRELIRAKKGSKLTVVIKDWISHLSHQSCKQAQFNCSSILLQRGAQHAVVAVQDDDGEHTSGQEFSFEINSMNFSILFSPTDCESFPKECYGVQKDTKNGCLQIKIGLYSSDSPLAYRGARMKQALDDLGVDCGTANSQSLLQALITIHPPASLLDSVATWFETLASGTLEKNDDDLSNLLQKENPRQRVDRTTNRSSIQHSKFSRIMKPICVQASMEETPGTIYEQSKQNIRTPDSIKVTNSTRVFAGQANAVDEKPRSDVKATPPKKDLKVVARGKERIKKLDYELKSEEKKQPEEPSEAPSTPPSIISLLSSTSLEKKSLKELEKLAVRYDPAIHEKFFDTSNREMWTKSTKNNGSARKKWIKKDLADALKLSILGKTPKKSESNSRLPTRKLYVKERELPSKDRSRTEVKAQADGSANDDEKLRSSLATGNFSAKGHKKANARGLAFRPFNDQENALDVESGSTAKNERQPATLEKENIPESKALQPITNKQNILPNNHKMVSPKKKRKLESNAEAISDLKNSNIFKKMNNPVLFDDMKNMIQADVGIGSAGEISRKQRRKLINPLIGNDQEERAAIAATLYEISTTQTQNNGRLESALAEQSRELRAMIAEIQKQQKLLQNEIQSQDQRKQRRPTQGKISFCGVAKNSNAEAKLRKLNPEAAKIAIDGVAGLNSTIKSVHAQIRTANESIVAVKASSIASMTNHASALYNDGERTRLLSSLECSARELKSELSELAILQQSLTTTENEVISEYRARLELLRSRLIQETSSTSFALKAERKGLEKVLSAFKSYCDNRVGKALKLAHKERKVQKRFSTTFLLPK